MTQIERDQFKNMLHTKRVELVRALGRRDGITIERTADALDEVRLAAERELTTRTLERESKLLTDVRGALSRIADGSYGACQECEEEISHKRLRAMPWATKCIACQEQADRDESSRNAAERYLKAA